MLQKEFGNRALVLANELAHSPEINNVVKQENIDNINHIFAKIWQHHRDADYIIFTDVHGNKIRYFSTQKPNIDSIENDIHQAFTQRKIIQSLFSTPLSKINASTSVPMIDLQHHILGVITIGFIMSSLHSWHQLYMEPIIILLFIILFSSIIVAYFLAKHVKNKMLNMEPEDLLFSFQCKSAILQSLDEGVIAVDDVGRIRSINQFAINFLGIHATESTLLLQPVGNILFPADFMKKISSKTIKNEIYSLNGNMVIMNHFTCHFNEKRIGSVLSFRPKNDMNTMSHQLLKMKTDTEKFRIMKHEFANKLATIGGLIQIGSYQDALEILQQGSQQTQEMVDFFTKTFNNTKVAGLLLSKYVRAREIGLHLNFDPACQLSKTSPEAMSDDVIITILGNLIDNAFEATLNNPNSDKQIHLFITDEGNELVIELTDNGLGVSPSIASNIFERGATTKSESGHGYGMFLIKNYVTAAGGDIVIEDNYPTGAAISLFIPLKGQAHESIKCIDY